MRLLLLILFPFITNAQINYKLKRELDSIHILDQKYRKIIVEDKGANRDSLWQLQNRIDSTNLIRIEYIIKKYGYPGKYLVGEPENTAVFFILQHSNLIDKYLPIIRDAAIKDELPYRLYAMMLDRYLVNQGKKQIYGTQATMINGKFVLSPIEDISNINKKRKKAGFTQTIKEYCKKMGIQYP